MSAAGSSAASEPAAAPPTAAAPALDVSPSLLGRSRGGPAAYEWKFLVDEATARRVEELLRDSLTLDPHADDRCGGGYLVTTVYFDTPDWDVLRGVGRHKLQKYRLRRYGDGDRYFVERKAKRGKEVRKRRDGFAGGGRELWEAPDASQPASGHWFSRQLRRQRLAPICRVQYLRRAYFGATAEGRVRLTFDRQLRGAPLDGWKLRATRDDVPILVDRVICEFKFAGAMPSLFKKVIQELRLEAAGYSKYRNGMRVFGLGPAPSSESPNANAVANDAPSTRGPEDGHV